MKEKGLRIKPRSYFRVSGPCTVVISHVAGKWVSMVVQSEEEIDVKWGRMPKVQATGPIAGVPIPVSPGTNDNDSSEGSE